MGISYGGKDGCYDDHAHGGHGRGQDNKPPAKGAGYDKPTPHASGAVVRDGTEGHGSKKRGYQTDAHSEAHHNYGEAVGRKEDIRPMNYDSPLYAEGKGNFNRTDHGQTFIGPAGHGAGPNKAEHHPRMGEAHSFAKPSGAKESHGFGYSATNRRGDLRFSGHDGAHQIGKNHKRSPSYKGKSLYSR